MYELNVFISGNAFLVLNVLNSKPDIIILDFTTSSLCPVNDKSFLLDDIDPLLFCLP